MKQTIFLDENILENLEINNPKVFTKLRKQRKINYPYRQLDLYGGVCYKVAFKKQEGGMWTPDKEGQELEGKVIDVLDGNFGKQYVIKKDDGQVISTPSHAFLQVLMRGILEGDTVKIVYKGTKPATTKGHSPSNVYEVFKDE